MRSRPHLGTELYPEGLELIFLAFLQACLLGDGAPLVPSTHSIAVASQESPRFAQPSLPGPAVAPPAQPRDGSTLPLASASDCGFHGAAMPKNARLHALNDSALGSLCYIVLLPAGGVSPASALPLLVFLHGLGAGPTNILKGGQLLEAVEAAQASGDWPEAIIVLPTGRDGYWADHLDGRHPWGSSVLAVVDAVRGAYPVLSDAGHTAIAGVSMGGFGALSLGLQHPERFGVVIGISATDLARAVAEQPDRDVYKAVVGTPADPRLLSAINPLHLVQGGKGGDQKFVLVWGAKEPTRFSTGARDLAAAMKAHDLSVVTRIVPGGTHAWTTTWTLQTMLWWLREAGKALGEQQPSIIDRKAGVHLR